MNMKVSVAFGCCVCLYSHAQGLSVVDSGLQFIKNPPVVEEIIWSERDGSKNVRHFFGRYQSNAIWLQELAEPSEDFQKFAYTNGLFIVKFENEYWAQNMASPGTAPTFNHWIDKGEVPTEKDFPMFKQNPLKSMANVATEVFSSFLNLGIRNIRPGHFRIEGDTLQATVPPPVTRPDGSKVPEIAVFATLREGHTNYQLEFNQVRKAGLREVVQNHSVQFSPTEATGELVPTAIEVHRDGETTLSYAITVHKIFTAKTPLARSYYDPTGFIRSNRLETYHLTRQGLTYTNALNQQVVLAGYAQPWYAKGYVWAVVALNLVFAYFIGRRLFERRNAETTTT